MIIMALNCGSSSVKYQLFDWDKKEVVAKGMVERVIIGDSFIMHEVPGRETFHHEQDCANHQAAIDLLIKTVTDPVHGVLKSSGRPSASSSCSETGTSAEVTASRVRVGSAV